MNSINIQRDSKLIIKDLCNRKIFGLKFYLRKIIKNIGYDKFVGIESITLLDAVSMLTYEIPKDILELLSLKQRLFGYYSPKYLHQEARIVLFVQEIYQGIPFPLNVTPMAAIRITKALTHELGHHLINKKQKIFDNDFEEVIVNRYAEKIVGQLAIKPQFKFWNWGLRELSSWHYAFANADYKLNNLLSAEEHFYIAWQLNPNHKAAAEWYWHIKERLSNNTDS